MKNILSSKIFIVVLAFIVGVAVGWFLWYLVYPNLHTKGRQVWTGTGSVSSSPVKTKTYTNTNTYSHHSSSSYY
jgi:hypothetical protein